MNKNPSKQIDWDKFMSITCESLFNQPSKRGRKPKPMPKRIADSPENVAKAVLNTPPRPAKAWRFNQK